MENEESVFPFDMRESIYFEDHQQISEITGISLEPEISIQTYGDYVSIRGVIVLEGEYQSVDNSVVEQLEPSFEKHALRYIDTVEADENGFAMFSHRFPVEISVPLYRVRDLDEVTVSIDTFDYAVPDPAQLVVDAEITINGISNQTTRESEPFKSSNESSKDWDGGYSTEVSREKESVEQVESETKERGPFAQENESEQETNQGQEEWESFAFDLKQEKESPAQADNETRADESLQQEYESAQQQPNQEQEEQVSTAADLEQRNNQQSERETWVSETTEQQEGLNNDRESVDRIKDEFSETGNESFIANQNQSGDKEKAAQDESVSQKGSLSDEESSSGRWKWTKTQSFDEFFHKKQEGESLEPESSSSAAGESGIMDPPETSDVMVESFESSSYYPDRPALIEKEHQTNEESEESPQEAAQADISYLSDIFEAREEEEQQFAKMKLCIVQDKDTLESIAQRYQITSMHIIKRNSLESENISPGQLLYIPVRQKEY